MQIQLFVLIMTIICFFQLGLNNGEEILPNPDVERDCDNREIYSCVSKMQTVRELENS